MCCNENKDYKNVNYDVAYFKKCMYLSHAMKAVPNFHAGLDLAAMASTFDMSSLISNILTGSSNALRPAFIRGRIR